MDVAARLSGAEGHCYVDVGLWGAIVPGNTGELARMVDSGVVGFACGLASRNGDAVAEADLRVAMPAITRLGVPLLVHPEAPGPIARAEERRQEGGPLARLLASRRSRRCYSDVSIVSAERGRKRGNRADDRALPGVPDADTSCAAVLI